MAASYESRYSVHPEYISTLPKYRITQHNLQMSGGQPYRSDGQLMAVCYCAYLIVMFQQTKMPVWDSIKKQDAEIDASPFLDSFVDGFAEGAAHFDKHYQLPVQGLYSSPEYVATINLLYYGDGSEWPKEHCQRNIRRQPITLEKSQFRKVGFWSGIAFRIESLMDKHPILFPVEANPAPATSTPDTTEQPAPATSIPGKKQCEPPDLTERERVLIHCYKELPAITAGQPGYADYLKFARPSDRTKYPNESKRMADSLIRSIGKIKPHLTELEKQQADSEISTIQAKFHNQL